MAKNSSWPGIDLGNKGPLKVLNGTKLILDDHGNNLDSFRISLESFRSFRGPLLHKPVPGQELFFAISYSKPALGIGRDGKIRNRTSVGIWVSIIGYYSKIPKLKPKLLGSFSWTFLVGTQFWVQVAKLLKSAMDSSTDYRPFLSSEDHFCQDKIKLHCKHKVGGNLYKS